MNEESATFTPSPTVSLGKLDVSIPEDGYEAGRVGTVRILIRNPFDVPVEIVDIQRPRSSHLCDEPSGRLHPNGIQLNNAESEQGGLWSSFLKSLSGATEVAVSGVSFAGLKAEFETNTPTLNINAEKGSKLKIDRELAGYHNVNIRAAEGSEVEILGKEPEPTLAIKQRVEPHCEIVAYFQIQTNGWLLFKPARMDLNTQICYTVNGQLRTQVTSCCLDVTPPLKSIVVGSLLGAALGSLARSLQPLAAGINPTWNWEQFAVGTGSAMVLSLIATVALSRRTGAQGFITVEDFFGGFVVGTLIGYQGQSYFDNTVMRHLNGDSAPQIVPPVK
jgi:hypothetical protein